MVVKTIESSGIALFFTQTTEVFILSNPLDVIKGIIDMFKTISCNEYTNHEPVSAIIRARGWNQRQRLGP